MLVAVTKLALADAASVRGLANTPWLPAGIVIRCVIVQYRIQIPDRQESRTRFELGFEGVDAEGGKDGWSPSFRLLPLRDDLRGAGDIDRQD